MKKFTALLLTLLLVFSFASCSQDADGSSGSSSDVSDSSKLSSEEQTTLPAGAPTDAITSMREKFDTLEYSAYTNIFYQDNASEYTDKTYTKEGIFAILRDEYNKVYRYYVWGYADKTRCCDWQWEFVPSDVSALPEPGSFVKLTGKFVNDSAALDKYWFVDTSLETVEAFSGAAADYDLTTDSPTLARVQIANIQGFPEEFTGQSIRVFGRALTTSSIQHPYYDGSWTMNFSFDGTAPAIGQYILVDGVIAVNGADCSIDATACRIYS